MMTKFRNYAAMAVATAVVVLSSHAFAERDALLDDSLEELDGKKSETAKSAIPEAEDESTEAKPAEAKPAAKAEVKEEPKAEAKEEPKAEVKEEPKAEEAKPEVKVEAEAGSGVEVKAETKVEAKEVAEEEVAEKKAEPKEGDAAEAKEEPAEGANAESKTVDATPSPRPAEKVSAPSVVGTDAELIANAVETEKLRRQAYDLQAMREIEAARRCMKNIEYDECAGHYTSALKLLNDRPATKKLRRECEQGVAEAIYRAAMEEESLGRRQAAIEKMEKALEFRHPKARRQLEDWNRQEDPNANKRNWSEVSHRRNDSDYKEMREANMKHLRRARQFLAVKDIDGALNECELVLLKDKYNQEAIRLREAIMRKRCVVLGQEFEATREGMISEVEKAWRPVYAPNAREIEAVASTTLKTALGDDPERAKEQLIVQRMKEMRLPTISFKPPATIIDAVDYFSVASRDYDKPDIPLEQRGFNFVLKTPQALKLKAEAAEEEESNDFSSSENAEPEAAQAGVPVIPMINARDISLYDALKLVCEQVNYKFKVQGPVVLVMHKDMSTDEMVTRSYPVLAQFLDRMDSASSELKEMKTAGFGSGGNAKKEDESDDNKQKDWKEFFSMMGVQWPEGSSILYIKTIGKLRVKNTYENLAELEKALTELNVDQKLVEIEARFIEVQQEDLNSLGFEWILNSDYAVGMDNFIGKALNLGAGTWGSESGSSSQSASSSASSALKSTYDSLSYNGGKASVLSSLSEIGGSSSSASSSSSYSRSEPVNPSGERFIKALDNARTIGVNAFGGSSEQQNGMRYLSTKGNHISGEDKSTNDQFMKVNAFIGNADLSMILHMLSQRSDTDLLNAPKVLTRPGEEAIIKVVTEYIYPTDYDVQLQTSSSSSGSSSSSSGGQSAILAVVEPQSFTMREVGVILDVTPTLTDDGNLIDLKLNTQVVDEPTWYNFGMRIPFTGNTSSGNVLDIGGIFTGLATALETIGAPLEDEDKQTMAKAATASALSAVQNLSTSSSANMTWYEVPMEQPWFHVRSIDSNISIYPGATIVMGGLITEARKAMDDKIPFLGDLPYLGRFFRSHAEQTEKRNLLIFVTTRLVDVRGREVTLGDTASNDGEVKAAPEKEDK